jgi:hypothetical protein
MKAQREIASFVLRFTQDHWQDHQGDPRIEWRGLVRHIQKGEEVRFTDLYEAMTFMQHTLLGMTMRCLPSEDQAYQEKVMQEGLKLWETFAQNYPPLLVEAIQQTLRQSESLQKQINDVIGQSLPPGWWAGSPKTEQTALPSTTVSAIPDLTQLQQQLVHLQSQLTSLTERVSQIRALLQNQRTA